MKRYYLTSVLSLCLAACATEPTLQPASGSTSRTASSPASASPDNVPAPADSAADSTGDGIVVVDTPDVPKVAVTDEQVGRPDGKERVCRRERRTGTHRAQRVCYSRAEIERMATKSKETFDDLNRSQIEY